MTCAYPMAGPQVLLATHTGPIRCEDQKYIHVIMICHTSWQSISMKRSNLRRTQGSNLLHATEGRRLGELDVSRKPSFVPSGVESKRQNPKTNKETQTHFFCFFSPSLLVSFVLTGVPTSMWSLTHIRGLLGKRGFDKGEEGRVSPCVVRLELVRRHIKKSSVDTVD